MWFQQDGAPAHYHHQVRQYLDNWMGNRWIGRRGPVAWPARSPDLTPLDFFSVGLRKAGSVQRNPYHSGKHEKQN